MTLGTSKVCCVVAGVEAVQRAHSAEVVRTDGRRGSAYKRHYERECSCDSSRVTARPMLLVLRMVIPLRGPCARWGERKRAGREPEGRKEERWRWPSARARLQTRRRPAGACAACAACAGERMTGASIAIPSRLRLPPSRLTIALRAAGPTGTMTAAFDAAAWPRAAAAGESVPPRAFLASQRVGYLQRWRTRQPEQVRDERPDRRRALSALRRLRLRRVRY